MDLAIIGGTGIDEMAGFAGGRAEEITTRFGDADVIRGKLHGDDVVFLPRHGLDHRFSPSGINYRAQIAALKKLGVQRVIGVCAVGSLRVEMTSGSFAVLSDFIDLTKLRQNTFFDGFSVPVAHTDFSEPYCPEISAALVGACGEEGVSVEPHATYVGVEGPRYESPAEIRLYSSWGAHVVGMTNLPEVVLAREAGLCYGAIAIVTNLAAGLSPTPLAHDEVRSAMLAAGKSLERILSRSIRDIRAQRGCRCSSGPGIRVVHQT